jgi:hypothetical protein
MHRGRAQIHLPRRDTLVICPQCFGLRDQLAALLAQPVAPAPGIAILDVVQRIENL